MMMITKTIQIMITKIKQMFFLLAELVKEAGNQALPHLMEGLVWGRVSVFTFSHVIQFLCLAISAEAFPPLSQSKMVSFSCLTDCSKAIFFVLSMSWFICLDIPFLSILLMVGRPVNKVLSIACGCIVLRQANGIQCVRIKYKHPTHSSADVLPLGKYFRVGKPETPNLEERVLSLSASTFAITTSSEVANASPSCS